MADKKDKSSTPPVQLGLALFDSRPEILKKPVQAVHYAITGGVQTKTQRLAFNAMLKNAHNWHAKNPDETTEVYEISRADLSEMIDYKSGNRKHLIETLRQMQELKVEWDLLKQDGESIWQSCVLLPHVAFDRDKIYYSYLPVIKPMLFDPTTYARLDLRIQRSFKLDASAALYEWCNRFRNNPSQLSNIMTWEQWRWITYGAIEENAVIKEYKEFKKRKLVPAIKEINAISDLEIELIEMKEGGRSVKNLQFVVRERTLFENPEPDENANKEWDKKLKDIGLTTRDRNKILKTYTIDVIEAHYRYTLTRSASSTQDKLSNVAAYFKNAIQNNYAADLIEKKDQPSMDNQAVQNIRQAFDSERNSEAAKMFAEMDKVDQAALTEEYNAAHEKEFAIPVRASARKTRLMIPFYAWLAKRTWGDPSPEELLAFAFKQGALTVNKG